MAGMAFARDTKNTMGPLVVFDLPATQLREQGLRARGITRIRLAVLLCPAFAAASMAIPPAALAASASAGQSIPKTGDSAGRFLVVGIILVAGLAAVVAALVVSRRRKADAGRHSSTGRHSSGAHGVPPAEEAGTFASRGGAHSREDELDAADAHAREDELDAADTHAPDDEAREDANEIDDAFDVEEGFGDDEIIDVDVPGDDDGGGTHGKHFISK